MAEKLRLQSETLTLSKQAIKEGGEEGGEKERKGERVGGRKGGKKSIYLRPKTYISLYQGTFNKCRPIGFTLNPVSGSPLGLGSFLVVSV